MQEVSGLYTQSLFLEKDQLKMMVLRARKVSEAFEKRVPGSRIQFECIFVYIAVVKRSYPALYNIQFQLI